MDYIGSDYFVGLECEGCQKVSTTHYSELLKATNLSRTIVCDHCSAPTRHDWRTAAEARRLYMLWQTNPNPDLDHGPAPAQSRNTPR